MYLLRTIPFSQFFPSHCTFFANEAVPSSHCTLFLPPIQLVVYIKLAMLEKALVDEHQYRTGKAALESELKAMLAKHQEALEPNDKVVDDEVWLI